MKYPKTVSTWLLAMACVVVSVAAVAAEPSMAQIYQAAEAGNVEQAQTMIRQVLQDHPNSAKAHFVEAELLVRQGQLAAARTELQTAERLAPGLPFAKADAVTALRTQLATSPRIGGLGSMAVPPVTARSGAGLWMPMLALLGILMAAYFFFRARNRPEPQAWGATAASPYATNANGPTPSYGGSGQGAASPVAPPATGAAMGSGILGGLAAGAAAGAGMVAGQALMHRMMDGNNTPAPSRTLEPRWDPPASTGDMGGDNFGITNTASWDDAGTSSDAGNEWS